IPAFIISFILFVLLSPEQTAASLQETKIYKYNITETGLMHWNSWIPLIIIIICTAFRVSDVISIVISWITATGIALFTSWLSLSEIWGIWFEGYTATTNFEPINELLTRGGVESMLFTISLVILALGFGGLLFVKGVIPSILNQIQEQLKRARSIIISTAATAVGINLFIGEQYLSI